MHLYQSSCYKIEGCILQYDVSIISVLVAEVTQASLGVGYEIGRAVAMDKRILCLFRPESDKRM